MRMIKATTEDGTEAWLNADSVESVCRSSEGGVVTMATGEAYRLDSAETARLLEQLAVAQDRPAEDGPTTQEQASAALLAQGLRPDDRYPGHWTLPGYEALLVLPQPTTRSALIRGVKRFRGPKRCITLTAVFNAGTGAACDVLRCPIDQVAEIIVTARLQWQR